LKPKDAYASSGLPDAGNASQPSRSRHPAPFTLIELLVVFAIIAIVAQLLLPVLSKARKKAMEIKCVSQCKEVGSCINMYAEDYKSYPIGKYEPRNITYSTCIVPYLWPRNDMSSPLLSCPDSLQSPDAIWISYAVHPLIMPDASGTAKPVKVGNLKRPSEIVVLAEACQKSSGDCDPLLYSIPGIMSPGLAADSDKTVEGDFEIHNRDGSDSNSGWPRWRHLYNCNNISFGDGHVSNLKLGSIKEGDIKINY